MPVLGSNLRVDGSELILAVDIAWRTETETDLNWLLRVDMKEEGTRHDDFLYSVSLPITPSPRRGTMSETRRYSFPVDSRLGTEIGDEEVYAALTLTPRSVEGSLVATDKTNVASVDE